MYMNKVEEVREELGTDIDREMKKTTIDLFAKLPDDLLIHILSFLKLEEAAITSVLSKRWRFLWSNVPRLEFSRDRLRTMDRNRIIEDSGRLVSWVNKTLAVRTTKYLEKFDVSFEYVKSFSSDVDAWVEFAVKSKVKQLILRLGHTDNSYRLQDMIYSNPSMTYFSATCCIMAPQRRIQWQSLTKLDLVWVEMDQHVIDEILSGCPILYSLDLQFCCGFKRLEVNSRSLYELTIEDGEDGEKEPVLEISAPYIVSLNILNYPEDKKLLLGNFSSLDRAEFNYEGDVLDTTIANVVSNTKELFESTQHVRQLTLSFMFFEAVSKLVANGWHLPQSKRSHLTVESVRCNQHCVSGIIGLLESSPNLETLIIQGSEGVEGYENVDLDPATKDDLDCDLSNLKIVKIVDFANPDGDPLLTVARILLKRATVLEKMEIETDVDKRVSSSIRRSLLRLPRSSRYAEVLFPY